MRHFLDSQNVRDQLRILRARARRTGILPAEARDGSGRRLFATMRDWFNQLPNPEYFDLGDLNLQFQSIYNYLGGELIDLPQLMQFADSYNAGDHLLRRVPPTAFSYDGMGISRESAPQLFEDWRLGHHAISVQPNYGCAPGCGGRSGVLTRGPALLPPTDRNPREFQRPQVFGAPLEYNRLGVASWAAQPMADDYTRVSDWAGVADKRPGFEFLEPKYLLDGRTQPVREGYCGGPPPVFRTALTRGYAPVAAKYPAPRDPPSKNNYGPTNDWIQYTLEPELLHDAQGNINRRFDAYKRCSGRESDQRMVKLEVSLADDQVDRSALRLPNARAQIHCANKKFPNEPLYYSSDPLANGSAYCNSESPFEDYV